MVLLPAGLTAGMTPLQLPPAGYLDQLAAGKGLKGERGPVGDLDVNVALARR